MERACENAEEECLRLLTLLSNERLAAVERFGFISTTATALSESVYECNKQILALENKIVPIQ